MTDYHRDPALSASLIRTMLAKSPRHAWHDSPALNPEWQPREDDAKFDVGTVAHQVLLEGRSAVQLVDGPRWDTKEKKALVALAREEGRIPLKPEQWEGVQAMVDAVRRHLIFESKIEPEPLTDGKPEVELRWDEDGIACKAKLDWLRDDLTAIDDVKTTSASAEPNAWQKTAYGMSADVQARWYQRAVEKVHGVRPAFRFVVVETRPPFALSVISLTPQAEALADSKIERALALWRECLATDTWPAYPTEVCYIDAPSWAEYQWLEREAREEAAA